MIRQGKVHAITCTGANLEEDLFNLVARSHYERIPHYRDLTAQQEEELLRRHLNRVTDTAFRKRKRCDGSSTSCWTRGGKRLAKEGAKISARIFLKILRECG
jgi:deoxyhypusine synthase